VLLEPCTDERAFGHLFKRGSVQRAAGGGEALKLGEGELAGMRPLVGQGERRRSADQRLTNRPTDGREHELDGGANQVQGKPPARVGGRD
jgi:hypothetical protein